MGLYISNVISIDDSKDGERIQARVRPLDNKIPDHKLPYAFPLLPKAIHVKPKVDEDVLIIIDDAHPTGQRYYIGPIISQYQNMEHDNFACGATTLLKGGVRNSEESVNNIANAIGALPDNDDVAFLGRRNSDIIMSDTDLKVRCGSRITKNGQVYFNTECPSFIKLKYHEEPLQCGNDKVERTATIVANKILLTSPKGDNGVNIESDNGELITDKELTKMIEKIHYLPYGDELVKFLVKFLEMFKSHTHVYHGTEPCPDAASGIFDMAYGSTEESIKKKILSKHIGIN